MNCQRKKREKKEREIAHQASSLVYYTWLVGYLGRRVGTTPNLEWSAEYTGEYQTLERWAFRFYRNPKTNFAGSPVFMLLRFLLP